MSSSSAACFVFGIFLGLIMIRHNEKMLRFGFSSRKWRTVQGHVVKAEVGLEGGEGEGYVPKVRFEYIVEGGKFISSTVSFSAQSYLKKAVPEAVARRYPVGKEVEVYYHPSNPGISVLEPGPKSVWWYVFGLVLGMILLVSCVLGLFGR